MHASHARCTYASEVLWHKGGSFRIKVNGRRVLDVASQVEGSSVDGRVRLSVSSRCQGKHEALRVGANLGGFKVDRQRDGGAIRDECANTFLLG